MVPEVVVFDFDGTLAHRPGLWSQCMLDVLDMHHPDHGVSIEDLRAHVRGGFPWHRSDVAHPELADADAWWDALGPFLDRVYQAVGLEGDRVGSLRAAVRSHYCDATRFRLFLDSVPALEAVRAAGARAVILSNHVPELDAIVGHHGLDAFVDDVHTSARIGYEKPHPDAFRHALGAVDPSRALMIGDNPVADKQGAEAVGMRAVLVRHQHADFATVLDAVDAHVTRGL